MLSNNKLEDIPWSSLKTTHGYASHIPSAIMGLNSKSESERVRAYWKLDNYVVLQSDLYEAAFYAVPFLIELLVSHTNTDKKEVYSLLYEIANGSAPEEIKVNVEDEEISLEIACHRKIGEHIALYLANVGEKSSSCRQEALNLLLLYPEFRKNILLELGKILHQEQTSFQQNIKEAMIELRKDE